MDHKNANTKDVEHKTLSSTQVSLQNEETNNIGFLYSNFKNKTNEKNSTTCKGLLNAQNKEQHNFGKGG